MIRDLGFERNKSANIVWRRASFSRQPCRLGERVVDRIVKINNATMGYEVRGNSQAVVSGIIVMHEILGLTDYIKDITRKLAHRGYLALAVDLYEGESVKTPDEGMPLREKITEAVFREKMLATINYLKSNSNCNGQLGIVGFCMGGGFALWAACLFPGDIKACCVFYGRIYDLALLKGLQAPVLGIFGEEDKIEDITAWAINEFKPEMDRLGKGLDMKTYPGAQHAFHNYTMPGWYHPAAAEDAWNRTLAFLQKHLGF